MHGAAERACVRDSAHKFPWEGVNNIAWRKRADAEREEWRAGKGAPVSAVRLCTAEGTGDLTQSHISGSGLQDGREPIFFDKTAKARVAPSSRVPHRVSWSPCPHHALLSGGHPEMLPVFSCIPCHDQPLTDLCGGCTLANHRPVPPGAGSPGR